jgi:hypothetical protein
MDSTSDSQSYVKYIRSKTWWRYEYIYNFIITLVSHELTVLEIKDELEQDLQHHKGCVIHVQIMSGVYASSILHFTLHDYYQWADTIQ